MGKAQSRTHDPGRQLVSPVQPDAERDLPAASTRARRHPGDSITAECETDGTRHVIKHTKALFIGISVYEDQDLQNLPSCAENVREFRNCLAREQSETDQLFQGRCAVVANARKEIVWGRIREHVRMLNEGELFLLVFSGHGFAWGGDVYMQLADARPVEPGQAPCTDGCIAWSEVVEEVGRQVKNLTNVTVAAFLDCCRIDVGDRGEEPPRKEVQYAKNVTWLVQWSTLENRPAVHLDGHTVFMGTLLKHVRRCQHQGRVRIQDLQTKTFETMARSDATQRPDRVMTGSGDDVNTELVLKRPPASPVATLPDDPDCPLPHLSCILPPCYVIAQPAQVRDVAQWFDRAVHMGGGSGGISSRPRALGDRDTELVRVAIVHGTVGVGKTTVAQWYVTQRWANYPGGVAWLRAEDDGVQLASDASRVLNWSTPARDAEHGHDAEDEPHEGFQEWLKTRQKAWLVVVDGVNSNERLANVLRRYIPVDTTAPRGHVIITSECALNNATLVEWLPRRNIRHVEVKPLRVRTAVLVAMSMQHELSNPGRHMDLWASNSAVREEWETALEDGRCARQHARQVAHQRYAQLKEEERVALGRIVGSEGVQGHPLHLRGVMRILTHTRGSRSRRPTFARFWTAQKLVQYGTPVERAFTHWWRGTKGRLLAKDLGRAALDLARMASYYPFHHIEAGVLVRGADAICPGTALHDALHPAAGAGAAAGRGADHVATTVQRLVSILAEHKIVEVTVVSPPVVGRPSRQVKAFRMSIVLQHIIHGEIKADALPNAPSSWLVAALWMALLACAATGSRQPPREDLDKHVTRQPAGKLHELTSVAVRHVHACVRHIRSSTTGFLLLEAVRHARPATAPSGACTFDMANLLDMVQATSRVGIFSLSIGQPEAAEDLCQWSESQLEKYLLDLRCSGAVQQRVEGAIRVDCTCAGDGSCSHRDVMLRHLPWSNTNGDDGDTAGDDGDSEDSDSEDSDSEDSDSEDLIPSAVVAWAKDVAAQHERTPACELASALLEAIRPQFHAYWSHAEAKYRLALVIIEREGVASLHRETWAKCAMCDHAHDAVTAAADMHASLLPDGARVSDILGDVHTHCAAHQAALGEYEAAERHLEQAQTIIAERDDLGQLAVEVLRQQAALAHMQNNHERATELITDAFATCGNLVSGHRHTATGTRTEISEAAAREAAVLKAKIKCDWGRMELEQGHTERARDRLREADTLLSGLTGQSHRQHAVTLAIVVGTLAEVHMRLARDTRDEDERKRHHKDAQECLCRAINKLRQHRLLVPHTEIALRRMQLAKLKLHCGDHAEAARFAEEARDTYKAVEDFRGRIRASLVHARALGAAGHRGTACEVLRRDVYDVAASGVNAFYEASSEHKQAWAPSTPSESALDEFERRMGDAQPTWFAAYPSDALAWSARTIATLCKYWGEVLCDERHFQDAHKRLSTARGLLVDLDRCGGRVSASDLVSVEEALVTCTRGDSAATLPQLKAAAACANDLVRRLRAATSAGAGSGAGTEVAAGAGGGAGAGARPPSATASTGATDGDATERWSLVNALHARAHLRLLCAWKHPDGATHATARRSAADACISARAEAHRLLETGDLSATTRSRVTQALRQMLLRLAEAVDGEPSLERDFGKAREHREGAEALRRSVADVTRAPPPSHATRRTARLALPMTAAASCASVW